MDAKLLILLLMIPFVYAECDNWETEHPEWIWCDDFDDSISLNDKYFEYDDNDGDFVKTTDESISAPNSMQVIFQQGEVEAGKFAKSFGRTPDSYIGGNCARCSEDFDDIYWRIYLKNEDGWQGSPAKLSRATIMATSGWAQAMIAHLWSDGDYLTLDPASGVNGGTLMTTKYNDFDNLDWLGVARGNVPLFSTARSDEWFCIESHARLNTPGSSNGLNEFWINDQLEAVRDNLNFRGSWDGYGINTIMIENYWNSGSTKLQRRYMDDFVISTERIGCGSGPECGDGACDAGETCQSCETDCGPCNGWRFAVAGDTRSDHTTHAQVIDSIINRIPNNERVTVLNTGDITANGIESEWETWSGIVEPLDVDWSKTDPPEYIGAVGNHDTHESGWEDRWQSYLPAQADLSAYSDISAHSQGLYGSVKYRNAIFIWIDDDSLPSGQDEFLEQTLIRAAQDAEVLWKFVASHKPPIPCGAKSDVQRNKDWNDDYFVPYGVDIYFLGHAHYYERTCPFVSANSKTCDDNNRGNSITDTNGVIHIVAGGGGASSYTPTCTSTCGSCPWLEKGEENHHFVEVEVNEGILSANVWDTETGGLIEQFTLTKEVPVYCGDGTCDTGECDSCPTDCSLVDCCPDGDCNNNETCDTCEADCDPCSIDCVHVADLPVCDGCVDAAELSDYIDQWKSGSVEMAELMEVIGLWKSGC